LKQKKVEADRRILMKTRLLIAAPFVILVMIFIQPAIGMARCVVQFKQVKSNLVLVPVVVNGTGPLVFVLDTGASTTIIDRDTARELRLSAVGSASLFTVAGTTTAPVYRVGTVAVGAQAVETLEAASADLSDLKAIDPDIRGVLGQDFLSRFNYLIDYQGRVVEFDGSRDSGDYQGRLTGTHIPIERDRGRALIVAQTAGCRKSGLRLVLDSGASRLVLFNEPLCSFDISYQQGLDRWTTATTILGGQVCLNGSLRHIEVGDESLVDLPVRFLANRQTALGRVEDGLLPTRLFRSIYFNNNEGYVVLNGRRSE
jgi:hypothetical protein